jgi:hypothetical protein
MVFHAYNTNIYLKVIANKLTADILIELIEYIFDEMKNSICNSVTQTYNLLHGY